MERLVINGRGDEREVGKHEMFPDKKKRGWDDSMVDQILYQSRELHDQFEIGQKEATIKIQSDYPDVPIVISLMTDTHYGSLNSDTKRLNEHLQIISNTPNFYMVHNGDHTDNFNATGKWASGMVDDPIPQQTASRAWAMKLKNLDDMGKVVALGFGNHDNFGEKAGQDYHETFLSQFRAPILTSGGLLHIKYGSQTYDLAMTHMYWGTSKLNPTNACKRFLDFEYPDADIVFLGHTHQSEGLHFEKGGKDRIAVIGGTYKDKDDWARKWGIGGRSGSPGWAVALYPHERSMMVFKDIEKAEDWVQERIHTQYER